MKRPWTQFDQRAPYRRPRAAGSGVVGLATLAIAALSTGPARAQQIDLSHGGPVTVSSAGGMQLDQHAQTVTFFGDARAVRGAVTVTADLLRAYYRKKATALGPAGTRPTQATASTAMLGAVTPATPGTSAAPAPASVPPPAAAPAKGSAADQAATSGGLPGTAPAGTPPTTISANPAGDDTGSNEIYRLEAIGHVHIFTATDEGFGDHAIYDMDKAAMVMTGHDLHLITPQDLLTARDSMEYYPNTRMSVGRGDAVVTTSDGRRINADVLVSYSDPPDKDQPTNGAPAQGTAAQGKATPAKPATDAQGQDPLMSSGKLRRADAFGHVIVRTQTETITGDRGVYTPATSIARVAGNVQITRGQNQLNGDLATINMNTGIATMQQVPGNRVQGLVVPNDDTGGKGGGLATGGKTATKAGSK